MNAWKHSRGRIAARPASVASRRDRNLFRPGTFWLTVLVAFGAAVGPGFEAHAQSVRGGLSFEGAPGGVPTRAHWGISASTDPNGIVSGEAQFWLQENNELQFGSHFSIEAMEFVDDKTVILSGFVTYDSDPSFIGSTVAFAVQDNGEKAGQPADRLAPALYGFYYDPPVDFLGADQELYETFSDFPLEFLFENLPHHGNIQVWPEDPPGLAARPVPEPSTVLMSALAALSVVLGRRRSVTRKRATD